VTAPTEHATNQLRWDEWLDELKTRPSSSRQRLVDWGDAVHRGDAVTGSLDALLTIASLTWRGELQG
jgi:hypothetical protein